jgi:heme/copper-type cytochrome/quinol oxidase subunit 4
MAKSRVASGDMDMALKAPGIITFMLSVILTVLAIVTKAYPEAGIPFITGKELLVLLVAQSVLIMGCIMRGL